MKAADFPMGVVQNLQVNDLGDVTGATILKGRSREIVKRHVNSLILLLSSVKVGTSVAPSPWPIEDDDFLQDEGGRLVVTSCSCT